MLGIDPRDWPVVSALLDQAMDLPPASRGAWLDALPAESAAYRDTLVRLLAADGGVETRAMFEALPSDQLQSVAADDTALASGGHVGPYVLISQIGRGGMGSVWLAERADGQPKRKVALKLPYLGWAPGLAERVDRERDILASLEHPNIARLYDAGVDNMGRPYLALEYVEGTPIDVYAQEHRLGADDRLRLLLQVAAAVTHAHAHLAVHRDLKPSNVLVNCEGDVRLLDFGIAKLLEDGDGSDSELTRLHGQALTPDYASPEQIHGARIGTASDVYSLGVVAYELLSGVRPYKINRARGMDFGDALDSVRVPPASRSAIDPTRAKELAGDIDAILNKALKRDPRERYSSVSAFADDLKRHLANVPVLAIPDALGYRARKFMARHALPLGAAAAVTVAVLAGATSALWQARAARLEAANAEQIKRFALSIIEAADTQSGAGVETTAPQLLATAATRVDRELADRPEMAAELLTSIANGLGGQGHLDEAASAAAHATDLARGAVGDDAVVALDAQLSYESAIVALGRVDHALSLVQETLRRARNSRAAAETVGALTILASLQYRRGEFDGAQASAQEAVNLAQAPANGIDMATAAEAWVTLADILRSTGRPGLLDSARHAVDLLVAIHGDKPTLPTLRAKVLLAQGLIEDGDVGVGLTQLESDVESIRKLVGGDHPRVAFFDKYLGDARLQSGDQRGAIDAYRDGLRVLGLSGIVGPIRSGLHRSLAEALAVDGQLDEALSECAIAATFVNDSGTVDPRLGRQVAATTAFVLTRLGRLEEAQAKFDDARRGVPGESIEGALVDLRLAQLRSAQGRHLEAVQLAQGSERILGRGPSEAVAAEAERTLGVTLLAAGRKADAAVPLQHALQLFRKTQIGGSPDQVSTARALEQLKLGT